MFSDTNHGASREVMSTLIKSALGVLGAVLAGQAFVYLLIQNLP